MTVPDTRSHRGPHAGDERRFAPDAWPALRKAMADLSWLLTLGYALPGAIQLVGNRYTLDARQRQAVTRCACTDEALARRLAKEVAPDALAGGALLVDGYNLLTTIEAALGGAVVLVGRDGACRDIAGVHGTYRRVEETLPALELVGGHLAALRVAHCTWYFDAPVSNSGRLKSVIASVAVVNGWEWAVEVTQNPDVDLSTVTTGVVVTADAEVLDRCARWASVARDVVVRHVPDARVVDFPRQPDPS